MPASLSEVGLAIKNFLKILENAAGTCFFQEKRKQNQKSAFKHCNYSLDIFSYHRKKNRGKSHSCIFESKCLCCITQLFVFLFEGSQPLKDLG